MRATGDRIAAIGGADIAVIAIEGSPGLTAPVRRVACFRAGADIVVVAIGVRRAAGFALRNAGIARGAPEGPLRAAADSIRGSTDLSVRTGNCGAGAGPSGADIAGRTGRIVVAGIRIVLVRTARLGVAAVGGAGIVVVAIKRGTGKAAIARRIAGLGAVADIVVAAVRIRGAAGLALRDAGIAWLAPDRPFCAIANPVDGIALLARGALDGGAGTDGVQTHIAYGASQVVIAGVRVVRVDAETANAVVRGTDIVVRWTIGGRLTSRRRAAGAARTVAGLAGAIRIVFAILWRVDKTVAANHGPALAAGTGLA